jgi:Xaa-Pro aminopeptidase
MLPSIRRAVWLGALAACCAALLAAIEPEPWDAFQRRRRDLAATRSEGAIVLFGVSEEQGRLGPGPLVQESNFYYLSGCREPGAVLLIEPAGDGRPYRETLFLERASGTEQEWNGRRVDPRADSAAAETGFAEVLETKDLEQRIADSVKRYGRLYTVLAKPLVPMPSPPDARERLDELGVKADPYDVASTVAQMRLIKSSGEIRAIEGAVRASMAAHQAAWRVLRPGLAEYEVFAEMSRAMILLGALRPAYPPIVASGPNATTLHYVSLTRKIEPGELVLMDVGGDFGGYAADLTRTVPADGRFTKRQREVYGWVLEAQQKAIAAARPGAALTGPGSLTELVENHFESKQKGLSRYFRHSVGHFIGLDVHDPNPLSTPLAEGMVITIEPGLYLPEEGLGIRIEDMLQITKDGARVLSAALPREAEEIERIFAAARDR